MAILEKREQELVHAIHLGLADSRLRTAAEKVRQAHLAVLKGKRHYIVDDGNPHFDGFKEIDAETAVWSAKTVEQIIEIYRPIPKIHRFPPPPFGST